MSGNRLHTGYGADGNGHRATTLILVIVTVVHSAFVVLTVWVPGWDLVDLDREHNLPTYFQSALLAAAALVSLDTLRLEACLFGTTGRGRRWAILSWPGVISLFAFLALDESLQIHEQFNTDEIQAWLKASSPLQGTVAWLVLLLPAIVGAVGCLLVWLGARARLSPRLVRWGGVGFALWLLSLVLEGTANSYFIPRDLYALEVILEETAETFGTTFLLCAIWGYRLELRAWLASPVDLPGFSVPWRRVTVAGALALTVPAAVVGASIALNPYVRHKSIGDEHLRAGRFEDAARAYQKGLERAPMWGRLWDRLGIAQFRRGDLEAAANAFAAAVRLEAKSATLLNHHGAVLVAQGRYGEALQAFERAAAVNPTNADAHRNLGITLRQLGRKAEAEAAFRRAEALGLSRVGITSLKVSLPAELALVYVTDERLDTALVHTRAGRLREAVEEYRRVLDAAPDLVPAHLGLANELLRWTVGRRLSRRGPRVDVSDVEVEAVRPSVVFTDWLQQPGGRWDKAEVTVEPAGFEGAEVGDLREAREHYQRALALGAAAPAHLGLAWLAREEGRPADGERHLAAALQIEPALPH